MKFTPAIALAAITIMISVATPLVVAGTWIGGTQKEVETLKTEQTTIREAIKPIPIMQTDWEWIKDQLGKITDHLGAPKAEKK
jgi:hypothetical protein